MARIASELRNRLARTEPGLGDPVQKSSALARLGPACIRPGLVDTSTVYVYMYIVYVYVVLTLVMRGKKTRNEVLNTAVTKLFLLHTCMYYYSTFIVAIMLDMTSQMLYCTLAIVRSMYTTMHAFHCFSMKNTTLTVYITEFSQKMGGGANALLPPPNPFLEGGPWPPWPPRGGPHGSA